VKKISGEGGTNSGRLSQSVRDLHEVGDVKTKWSA